MLKIFKFVFLLILPFSLFSHQLITPIPNKVDYNNAKAQLGKRLFFDTRLSSNDTISCATCHDLNNGGDDGLAVSFGVDGRQGVRNSPTVYNARYNFVQFWDGRAKDLQAQAEGPIHNELEMDSNFKEVIKKLSKDPYYLKAFEDIYTDGITAMNITDAIAEFEKSLVTPNSRFDKFLRGDDNALNKQEKEGYQAFLDYGCISCHNGINIGGNLYQKIGIIRDFHASPKEFGRYTVTRENKDILVFKVPSLRNIELTAPYFHDGKVEKIEEAVTLMIKYQIGITLNEDDVENIVAFLKTLTGEKPKIVQDMNTQ